MDYHRIEVLLKSSYCAMVPNSYKILHPCIIMILCIPSRSPPVQDWQSGQKLAPVSCHQPVASAWQETGLHIH